MLSVSTILSKIVRWNCTRTGLQMGEGTGGGGIFMFNSLVQCADLLFRHKNPLSCREN